MPEEDRPASYRIGDLTVDLVRRNVRRRGKVLPCGKLTFELLVLLAQRWPAVVGREELIERLWDGRYASPATVKQRVSLLRQALGDRADNPRYVRAARGQGYTLIPKVQAVNTQRERLASGSRLAIAASAVVAAFLVGAETGYRDGLEPRIPDLAESTSILVTSWPAASRATPEHDPDLPREDYLFVMGMANRVLSVLEQAQLARRLDAAHGFGEASGKPALTVVANASTPDAETISVSVTVLNESLSDNRLARIYAMQSYRQASGRKPESIRLARLLDEDLRAALARDDDIRIFLPAREADRALMLVARFDFDRDEMQQYPQAIQADAARSIAMAIDEQVPRLRSGEPAEQRAFH